jgi:hypothetical protein
MRNGRVFLGNCDLMMNGRGCYWTFFSGFWTLIGVCVAVFACVGGEFAHLGVQGLYSILRVCRCVCKLCEKAFDVALKLYCFSFLHVGGMKGKKGVDWNEMRCVLTSVWPSKMMRA